MGIKQEVLSYFKLRDDGRPLREVFLEQGVAGGITERTLVDLFLVLCDYLEKKEPDYQPPLYISKKEQERLEKEQAAKPSK